MTTEESTVEGVGSDGKPGVIGQNLRRLLDEKNMGVNELARLAGIPKPSTGRSRDTRVETQQRLAKALEVSPDDLTITRAELAESERILVAFEKDQECKRLIPPYSPADASRLRARRSEIVRTRLPPKGIRLLVRQLRAANHEPDFSE